MEFPKGTLTILGAKAKDTSGKNVMYARMSSTGALSQWTSLTSPADVTFTEVSAAVSPSSSSGDLLALVARNDGPVGTNEIWMGWITLSGAFTGWFKAEATGVGTVSSMEFTPGLATGPDGRLYMVVKASGVNTNNDPFHAARKDLIDIYWYSRSGLSWQTYSDEDLSTMWSATADHCVLDGRPGILFRPHRRSDGTPVANGNGALWIWWTGRYDGESPAGLRCVNNYGSPIGERFYRQTHLTLNAITQAFNMGYWYSPPAAGGTACMKDGDVLVGGGITLVDHPTSMSAFHAQLPRAQATGDPGCNQTLYHIPYADGQARSILRDHNDHLTIGQNLCLSLYDNSLSSCTTLTPPSGSSNSLSFAVSSSPESQICDIPGTPPI